MKHLFSVLGVSLLILLVGCQSAPMSGGSVKSTAKSKSKYAVEWDSLKVVGYLALGSSAADRLALEMLEPRIETEFLKLDLPFVLMRPSEVTSAASRHDLVTVHGEMVDHWRDSKKVNKLKLQALCEALHLDAVLVANIDEWTQVQAAPGSTEPSFTRIAMTSEIWLPETGRRGWRKRTSERWEAEQLRTEDADTQRESHGIAPSERVGSEPPRYEEVADRLALKAAEALADAARR